MYTHELVTANPPYEIARRHPRFMISIPVEVTRLTIQGSPTVRGLSLDLSRGGASAVLCGPPVVGEQVAVSLQFLEASLQSLAIVRHSSSTRSGFEFVELSAIQRELLESRLQVLQERVWPWKSGTIGRPRMP